MGGAGRLLAPPLVLLLLEWAALVLASAGSPARQPCARRGSTPTKPAGRARIHPRAARRFFDPGCGGWPSPRVFSAMQLSVSAFLVVFSSSRPQPA
jgi:hypothetical protein